MSVTRLVLTLALVWWLALVPYAHARIRRLFGPEQRTAHFLWALLWPVVVPLGLLLRAIARWREGG